MQQQDLEPFYFQANCTSYIMHITYIIYYGIAQGRQATHLSWNYLIPSWFHFFSLLLKYNKFDLQVLKQILKQML